MYKKHTQREIALLVLVSLFMLSSVFFIMRIDQLAPTGNIVAQGGRITNASINQSANTGLWALMYGYFDYATGISDILLQGGNVTRQNVRTYGYDASMVIIAYTSSFNQSNISQATPNLIDAYMGVGPAVPESGTNTFDTLYNITIGTSTYELYGAQTISSNATYITAAFLSNGDLGFVTTTQNGTAFDGSNTSYQLFVPANGAINYSLTVVSNLTCPDSYLLDAIVWNDNESVYLNWSEPLGTLTHELSIINGLNSSNQREYTTTFNLTPTFYLDTTNETLRYYRLRTYLPAYLCTATNEAGMNRIEMTPTANLISFPYEFVNDSIDEIVRPVLDNLQSVNRYNNTDQIYDFYIQFGGSIFKNFDTVLRGEGYWFTVNNTVNLTYAGRVNDELNITIYNRSNLIGFPPLQGNITVPYVLRSIDGNYSTLNVYNNSAKLYGFYIIFGGSVFSNFDEIEPTLGYWLQANESETLVLP